MTRFAIVLALALLTADAWAADSLKVAHPDVTAGRRAIPITLDGILSEPVWASQPAESSFTQSDPDQGRAPTFPTIVRILYDDEAIYVGARMVDAHADSIVARLCRRDDSTRSDEFTIYLDPYHDRRTGYWFVISAAGVLRDGVMYNDDWDDDSWDGVWQGRARIDSTGWTAEMRIPYSQLRFRKSDQYRWGVNFRRYLARRNEYDMVAYTPRKESGFVSRFPDLVGIQNVSPSRAIQVTPYATTRGEFLQHSPGDPFNDGSRYVQEVGGDLKMAVGSKLTLNAAVNPDFGQVEVDPAVVNLSDVETFFPEKRPFFVEGSNNYDFGSGGSNSFWGFNWPGPSIFYSRRIGRAPEIQPPSYDFARIPQGTRILGAGKLTGKIAGDWNLGVMQAITQQEHADILLGGARSEFEVEPQASYSVLRLEREFHGGRQGFGTVGTLTARHLDQSSLRDLLNGDAGVAGLDGWTFLGKSRKWVVTGWTGMSRLEGTQQRILDVQQNSTHYLQRPDASRWRLDPNATSLTGYAGRFTLNKQQGSAVFNTALGFINPHFDTNDLGFLSRSDVVNAHVATGYRWSEPDKWKRYAGFQTALFGSTDFDGNLISPGFWSSGDLTLLNYWYFGPRFSYNPRSVNNRLTRGGPLTISPARWDAGIFMDTDMRKPVYLFIDTGVSRSNSGGWDAYFGPGMTWKPKPGLQIQFNPNFDRNHQNSQWVGATDDAAATATYGRRYVFAELDQTTLSASVRMNWAFTPNASLQVYVQPLMSSGNYFQYKQLLRARSYDWEPVGTGVPQYDPGTDKIDLDGPGGDDPYNPDFNFTSLRGNAILRWEYMPGSTLFLVWTQERSGEADGVFELGPSLSGMIDQKPNNIFLIKATYYLNL